MTSITLFSSCLINSTTHAADFVMVARIYSKAILVYVCLYAMQIVIVAIAMVIIVLTM